MRLECITIDDIDLPVEQTADKVFQTDIIEDCHARRRIELDHNVDIAVRPMVAPRTRTEQGSVTHTPRAQQRLTFEKFSENFFAIHDPYIGETGEFVSTVTALKPFGSKAIAHNEIEPTRFTSIIAA